MMIALWEISNPNVISEEEKAIKSKYNGKQIAWNFNRIWKLSPQDSLNLRACWFHGAQRSCSDNCTSFELSSWIFFSVL